MKYLAFLLGHCYLRELGELLLLLELAGLLPKQVHLGLAQAGRLVPRPDHTRLLLLGATVTQQHSHSNPVSQPFGEFQTGSTFDKNKKIFLALDCSKPTKTSKRPTTSHEGGVGNLPAEPG